MTLSRQLPLTPVRNLSRTSMRLMTVLPSTLARLLMARRSKTIAQELAQLAFRLSKESLWVLDLTFNLVTRSRDHLLLQSSTNPTLLTSKSTMLRSTSATQACPNNTLWVTTNKNRLMLSLASKSPRVQAMSLPMVQSLGKACLSKEHRLVLATINSIASPRSTNITLRTATTKLCRTIRPKFK